MRHMWSGLVWWFPATLTKALPTLCGKAGTARKAGTAYLNTAGSKHESENWGQDPDPLLWPDWLLPRCWTLWLTFTWLPLEQLWMLPRLNGVACPLSQTFHPDFKMPFLSFSVNPPKPYMCDPQGGKNCRCFWKQCQCWQETALYLLFDY